MSLLVNLTVAQRVGQNCTTSFECNAGLELSVMQCQWQLGYLCGCGSFGTKMGGPECTDLTSGSGAAVAGRSLQALGLVVTVVAALRYLPFAGRRCTFSLSILLWIFWGATLMLISRLVSIANFSVPMDYYVVDSVTSVFEAAGASLCIVGALNLSLMWIEFVLATKRLERLSNNLRLTKKILVGYMIGFCALEVILITLQIVVSGAFYNLTMGLSLITAILIIITFLVGASKLNKVYGKAAESERVSAATMQTSATMQVGQTQEEEAAALEEAKAMASKKLAAADSLDARAKRIARTARLVAIGFGTFVLATVVWLVVRPLMIIGLEWAVAVVMQTGACFSAVAIAVYVGGTLQKKKVGPS